MSDIGDEQDRAESVDSDHLGTADDPDVEPGFPADRPLGVEEYGLTSAEEQVGEPLDERVEREVPDPLLQELEGTGAPAPDGGAPADGSVPAEEAALHVEVSPATDPDATDPGAGVGTLPDEDRPPR